MWEDYYALLYCTVARSVDNSYPLLYCTIARSGEDYYALLYCTVARYGDNYYALFSINSKKGNNFSLDFESKYVQYEHE